MNDTDLFECWDCVTRSTWIGMVENWLYSHLCKTAKENTSAIESCLVIDWNVVVPNRGNANATRSTAYRGIYSHFIEAIVIVFAMHSRNHKCGLIHSIMSLEWNSWINLSEYWTIKWAAIFVKKSLFGLVNAPAILFTFVCYFMIRGVPSTIVSKVLYCCKWIFNFWSSVYFGHWDSLSAFDFFHFQKFYFCYQKINSKCQSISITFSYRIFIIIHIQFVQTALWIFRIEVWWCTPLQCATFITAYKNYQNAHTQNPICCWQFGNTLSNGIHF